MMQMTNRMQCPKCKQTDTQAVAAQRQSLVASYGVLSAQEFIDGSLSILRSQRRLDSGVDEMLVEAAEVGVVGPNFVVTYNCRCSKCGFTITYSRSVDALTAGA